MSSTTTGSLEADMDKDTIQAIIEHVVLPPRLPQQAPSQESEDSVEGAISALAAASARRYASEVEEGQRAFWITMANTLDHFATTTVVALDKYGMEKDIQGMVNGDVLAFHIHEQNAAVIVRKGPEHTVFEAFEVLSPNFAVVGCTGKLIRVLPGPAVQVAEKVMQEEGFLDQITTTLSSMDLEHFGDAVATSRKANSKHMEIRDSAHPKLVTELFIGILRGYGEATRVKLIKKRVADEVLFMDARRPWRRSRAWFILRVLIQTSAKENLDFKLFMIHFIKDILHLGTDKGLDSDLLYVTRAKMARRVEKLGSSTTQHIVDAALHAARTCEDLLQSRWTKIQAGWETRKSLPWTPAILDIKADTQPTLPNCRQLLRNMFLQQLKPRSTEIATIKDHPNHQHLNFVMYSSGGLEAMVEEEGRLALFDFERSVLTSLSAWTDIEIATSNHIAAASSLESCFKQYCGLFKRVYSVDVVDRSFAILILLQLWTAIDRIAVSHIPLLSQFSPEVHEGLLRRLLLSGQEELDTLHTVETWIRRRHREATPKASVFSSQSPGSSSFIALFFKNSTDMQNLKNRIEQEAEATRARQLVELQTLNNQHAELVEILNLTTEHDDIINPYTPRQEHWKQQCSRCRLEKKLANLNVAVHEWPLPSDEFRAQMVVFELAVPAVFSCWRDVTYIIMHDLTSIEHITLPNAEVTLIDENQRRSFRLPLVTNRVPRITLASSVKPISKSHYATRPLPAIPADIVSDNGLDYRLYDVTKSSWVPSSFELASFTAYGTQVVSAAGPYAHLQYAIPWTTHSTNQVVADRSNCSPRISLQEHDSFGSLRSGAELQWLNILRELQDCSLAFRHEDVYILLSQAAWQVGERQKRGDRRSWHEVLLDDTFANRLIMTCTMVLEAVRSNWVETSTVRILTMLICRLMAGRCDRADNYIRHAALQFLQAARETLFMWLGEVKKGTHLDGSESAAPSRDLISELATACKMTYDLHPEDVRYILDQPSNVHIFIETGVALYESRPEVLETMSNRCRILFGRDDRLSHRLAEYLVASVRLDRSGFDTALSNIWTEYHPGLDAPGFQGRWLCVHTGSRTSAPQEVRYNLLSGQLLVNGRPLGQLPTAYTTHAFYLRIFGNTTFDVIPGSSMGFDYVTRSKVIHAHYQLAWSLHGSTLRIQARSKTSKWEMIPHQLLEADFPGAVVHNFSHWMNLASGEIEFRPLTHIWRSTPDNWRLRMKAQPPCMTRTVKGTEESFIDYHSPTFGMVASMLQGLEQRSAIYMIQRSNDGALLAILPRLRLQFILSGQLLESIHFPGMFVDEQQTCGALIGLQDQLVLRPKRAQSGHVHRQVLIPHGHVIISRAGDHVHVSIEKPRNDQHSYFMYNVDADMGRLSGETSLSSRLFKIYLHAATTYCLADPLTGRMGVEEALEEITSAATQGGFTELTVPDLELIDLIRSLSPRRTYYPSHLRCMETVTWSPAPILAQHPAFAGHAHAILDYAAALNVFSGPSAPASDGEPPRNPLRARRKHPLVVRSTARIQQFYPSESIPALWTQDPDLPEDVAAPCRDIILDVDKEHMLIAAYSAVLEVRQPRDSELISLKAHLLDHTDDMSGPDDSLALGYSSSWLSVGPSSWLSVYEAVRKGYLTCQTTAAQHRLSFSLASMAWASPCLRQLVPLLVIMSSHPALPKPPRWMTYDLTAGNQVEYDDVLQKVEAHKLSFDSTPLNTERKQPGESNRRFKDRCHQLYTTTPHDLAVLLANHFVEQHPLVGVLATPWDDSTFRPWFDMLACTDSVSSYLLAISQNDDLFEHLDDVSTMIWLSHAPSAQSLPHPPISYDVHSQSDRRSLGLVTDKRLCTSNLVTLETQVRRFEPSLARLSVVVELEEFRQFSLAITSPHRPHPERSSNTLADIIERLRGAAEHQSLEDIHGQTLQQSLVALSSHAAIDTPQASFSSWEDVHRITGHNTRHWSAWWVSRLAQIKDILDSPENGSVHHLAHVSAISPRVSLHALLRLLSYGHRQNLPPSVSKMLRNLAVGYMMHQHARRLWNRAARYDLDGFSAEHASWRIDTSYETLDDILLQIEGNFRIRPHQLRVAREMIQPSAPGSTIMQLNMGEGKSSVIIPMVVTAVANGQRFARVIVLKALSAQMFHLLVARLGGLVNRRVYYMPFSRQVDLSSSQNVDVIHSLLRRCVHEGGVMLAQPEHVLSFKLMSIDRRLHGKSSKDSHSLSKLEALQSLMVSLSRDILDEADAVLDIKYQLVYTSGTQRSLDDSPDRWVIIQQLLSLTASSMADLKNTFPNDIDYRPIALERFPIIRILQTPALDRVMEAITNRIGQMILDGGVSNINLSFISEDRDRLLLLRFLTCRLVDVKEVEKARALCGTAWKGCLLIRGMLAFGVLEHVLKDKRYRVNYGLCAKRSQLAVPYSAKDIPTLRSEFSHPDVAISLTALSYYYAGLTEDQLLACFGGLLQTDDPEFEFHTWTLQCVNLPQSLRRLAGINTRDVVQFRSHVYPIFAHNHSTINFFLSHAVFPKEAREFSHKLATSGWDLVEKKPHITTGFSGTNDRQYLLPTSIKQTDPVQQASTNALVLSNLLQEENNHYHRICDSAGVPLTTQAFLGLVNQQRPYIRVVLDVGAQMLDLRNQDLAAYWLSLHPVGVSAAVFFDDRDELVVLSMDGNLEPLESSTYKQSMDKVVVYLDDAHTRGTDLHLPKRTRAAVTLGPDVTKDRLVQGCMRMRQLGRGHSVVFFAPPECDARIRALCDLSALDQIQVQHIVRWVIQATCEDIRHYAPHWVQQGIDHARRNKASEVYRTSPSLSALREAWVTQESHSLEEMYGLQGTTNNLMRQVIAHPILYKQLLKLRIGQLSNPHVDEEQEREITHEIERERHVKRPPPIEGLKPNPVHSDVRTFIRTGVIPSLSKQFQPLFGSLRISPVDQRAWSQSLLATLDFNNTVSDPKPGQSALYAKPLRWIVSSKQGGRRVFVAMSPFEVNQLLPTIRSSTAVHLHIYVPKVVQSMESFSDLRYHVIPSLPAGWQPPSLGIQSQLNLFAGQLFVDSWDAYVGLCAFLGVYSHESPRLYGREIGLHRGSDGFIRSGLRSATPALARILEPYEGKSFQRSVIEALREHVSSTRNGKDFLRTHIGQLLHGRLLAKKDFE